MRVIPQGAGRHKWTRYYAVRAKGVDSSFAPRAFFSMDGFRMEAPLYLVDGAGTSSQLFVIAFPYLETGKQAVDLLDERERLVWHVAFTSRSFDVGNSITCRIRPSLTKLMRGIELAHSKQSAFIEPIGVYPFDSEHEVIRIRVSYPEGVADIHLDPVRVLVNERAAESLVLECGVGDDGHHHVIMSYRLRKNAGGLLFATSGGDGFLPWIFYLSPDYRSRMVHEFAEMTRDAAGDESYPMWFEKQRASEEALMEQRSHRFPFEPLMSIVVPVYNVPLDFLKDCIRSIRVQSYAAWELIVANADSGNNEVSSWLEEAASHDSRIVVVNLPENKGDRKSVV